MEDLSDHDLHRLHLLAIDRLMQSRERDASFGPEYRSGITVADAEIEAEYRAELTRRYVPFHQQFIAQHEVRS